MNDFSHKNIVVTGAASGVGAAVVAVPRNWEHRSLAWISTKQQVNRLSTLKGDSSITVT